MPYCPACGHQHAATDQFCAQCGQALVANAAPPAPGVAPAPAPVQPTPAAPIPEQLIWEGKPYGLLNPIESHAIRWELTTERLRIIRGLLGRQTEDIELTRVHDVSYEQSLAQRALGIGNIVVVATDAETPTVMLHDVEQPDQVKELIRQAVLDRRQRMRVRQFEVDDRY